MGLAADIADIKTQLTELVSGLEKTVPYAAALYKRSSGTRINVNRVQETVEQIDPSEGVVFTLWNGQSFFEASFNRLDWAELKNNLAALARTAMQSVDPSQAKTEIDPGPNVTQTYFSSLILDPVKVPLEKKLAQAKDHLNTALSADKRVTNAISVLGDVTHDDVFVNRHKVISQHITRVDVILVVYLTDGQKTSEVHDGFSKNAGFEIAVFPKDQIEQMVRDGIALLKAERLKPGVYDTVVDPEWAGIIAHECFGHGMETDLYTRERALSRLFIGKPVASDIVNMFDDPSNVKEAGGFLFDDEGQLSSSTHIIKNGILERGLTDMASAHKLNLSRSANGRRESYSRKAYARMTNTFFGNGGSSPADVIRSVENGLYLRHATNGMEDPQAWGIQVEGLWAQEIKNGRLTDKVYSPVIMTGFVPDLLKSISMVGNDGYISGLGMCGKGHKEWVKNTTGGPHLRLKARLA